jgi:hypothetical protein
LMVLSENPTPIRVIRSDVPDDLARVVERCLEKAPAARFASVAELAAALERYAPADTRELAMRIARITSGSKLYAPQASTSTSPIHVPSPTTANWSAKTALARSSRGKVVALSVVVSAAAVAAVVGVVGALTPRNAATSQAMASAVTISAPAPAPAPATATPIATIAPSAAVATSPIADAGAARFARPRRDVVPPADSAPASEPPKYRTSW